ncbi:hypothetical protein GUJ93_ZPchr0006g42261 [Zizania palustris]|uniref:Cyclic nucleotide-binding domain-containing protein n=1 Tax=Zizania palustris TaxID=103762 RepID=A0A8J5S899_ZIZPA|nr:hypothetical protein GUJ93_ZPchr0006g42261 [Zizania palustris]
MTLEGRWNIPIMYVGRADKTELTGRSFPAYESQKEVAASLRLCLLVPMFENMDDQLLDAMCDRLKPMLYTEASCIIRKGDLARDFCGEELLTWALDPTSASNLPSSTRTVKTLSEVEAFALRV